MPQHILIISHDSVGTRMAGTGIRYWEIAHALSSHFSVTLVAPNSIDIASEHVVCRSYQWGNERSLARWLRDADIVVTGGHVLHGHPQLAHIRQPLVVDLSDPTLLENIELFRNAPSEQRHKQYHHDQALLQRQLSAGDFFLCATERQRDLYLGALMLLGRTTPEATDGDPLLHRLIDIVPSGIPDNPPSKQASLLRSAFPAIGNKDPLLLWSGGLWDWMDPLTLVEAMPQVIAEIPQVRLVFLAGQHPGNAHPMRMPQLAKAQAEAYGLDNRHIFFYHTWIPYQQRADVLLDADIAVSLHQNHLETHYAALRSRILDHLWAGLPSVVSMGDAASVLLQQAEAGLAVPCGNSSAVAKALVQLLSDTSLRTSQIENARQLAQHFAWSRVVAPLVHFCQNPRKQRTPHTEYIGTSISPTAPNDESDQTESQESIIESCRNAAIAVQEQGWKLKEQPLAGGTFAPLRRFLIDQIVRPFVAPFVEQQQTHNAAILRTMYAMNELNDETRRMNKILQQQVAENIEHIAGLEDADTQMLKLFVAQQTHPNRESSEPL